MLLAKFMNSRAGFWLSHFTLQKTSPSTMQGPRPRGASPWAFLPEKKVHFFHLAPSSFPLVSKASVSAWRHREAFKLWDPSGTEQNPAAWSCVLQEGVAVQGRVTNEEGTGEVAGEGGGCMGVGVQF